jgi:xylose isomerase
LGVSFIRAIERMIKKKFFLINFSGREGYITLLNTDVRKELDHLAAFFRMAVEHKKKIGFKGQFLIEPKPKEPTKHQCK